MWINFDISPSEDKTITNAFSLRGIYQISSNEEVQCWPRVEAGVKNQKMFLAVDTTLFLLDNETFDKCNIITFEAKIDCLTTSSNGTLLVCGLSNGNIHGISISGVLLFRCCVNTEDANVIGERTFAAVQYLNNNYYFTCINGSVYKLSDIDEELGEFVGLHNNGSAELSSVSDVSHLKEVNLMHLFGIKSRQEITAAILISQDVEQDPWLIAGSLNTVYQRITQEDRTFTNLPDSYKGVKCIYNLENDIILLTNSGHVLKYCPYTNTLMHSAVQLPGFLVHELLVMECNQERIEFLVLGTKNDEGDCKRYLNVVEYPAFKSVNEMEVGECAWLVQQPKSSVNLYFISGNECNSKGVPTILELMHISEADPSDRFKKLIAKGCLKEAEDYGREYELCLQPLYEARAKRLLIEMSCLEESDTNEIEKRFSSLIKLFNQIENKDFFRAHRSFSLPSRQILQKYLQKILEHMDAKIDIEAIEEIREELHRLETLAIVDPYEINADWLKFVHHPKLTKYVMTLFKTDMSLACLIWSRHYGSMLPHLTDNELRKLLTMIPADTNHFHLLQWLRQFVPTASNTHPTVMPFVAEWSIQKTHLLHNSKLWPEIGLEFCTGVMEVFEETHFMHSDVRRQQECNIVKLRDLVNALQHVCVLKNSYNLTFTLDNYLQDSIDATAKCMLMRVNISNLKSLVNDFLYPIYQEKGQSPVAAIKRYVTLLVASRNSFSSWLERSAACIELLHNEDDRLEMTLLVLQNAPVPWPPAADPLLKVRYSTHPLAEKIQHEYELQVIKIMKTKYGWPTDTAADTDLHLFTFRIVKMALPEMLDDIRMLVKAVPQIANSANFNCCHHLVRHGKLDEAFEFFKMLKEEKNGNYANVVMDIFANLLENAPLALNDKTLDEQRNQIEFYRLVAGLGGETERRRLRFIENRFILKHTYEINIEDVNDLAEKRKCCEFLDFGITNMIKRLTEESRIDVGKYFLKEIKKLSKALNFSCLYVLKRLCEQANCLLLTCVLTYNIIEILDCGKDSKDDCIGLALVLIIQQIRFIRDSPNSDASNLIISHHNYWAFPLAYDLLAQAALFEDYESIELIELMNYIRLVVNCFPPNSLHNLNTECDKHLSNVKLTVEQQCNNKKSMIEKDMTLNNSQLLNMSYGIKNKEKRDSVSMFDNVEATTLPTADLIQDHCESIEIVIFVARTLLLLLVDTEPTNDLLIKLKSWLIVEDSLKIADEKIRNDFFLSLAKLIKVKKHDVWYTMTQYLIRYQQQHNCRLINTDFVSLHIGAMLKDGLKSKDANFLDLFNTLIIDAHAEVYLVKLSQQLKTDQQKVNFLTLEEMYNTHFKNFINVDSIRSKRIKHYYYMQLCKQDPSILGKFNPDNDSIEILLKHSHNKQLDVHLLERMSHDFNLNYQNLLVAQVISILQAQEMRFEIKMNVCGEEELNMITTIDSIRQQCQSYLAEIKNTDLLTSRLKQFIEEIHIYFYELYLCVIEILQYFNAAPPEMKVWTSILHFLKHKMITRRHNGVANWETDLWTETQKEFTVLRKIARYRLPFKPIVQQPLDDILQHELNVNNCVSWFPLIQMHTILKGSKDVAHNCDYFCMAAVLNSIAEYKSNSDQDLWHKQPTNNAFLKSILRLVKHVHNPSKAFLILYFASNYAPEGADQVEASYECYNYIMENKTLITDPKCQEKLEKMKRKYPNLKTQHLLHVYGLVEEKLMSLIDQPKELICHLYHHKIILHGGKLNINVNGNETYLYVNINALAEKLSELHNLNLKAIQYTLLHSWLLIKQANKNSSLDETLIEEQQMLEQLNNEPGLAAENVVRANYIIKSWEIEEARSFLIANIFQSNGSMNTSQQLQMYECYFKLYDGSNNLDNMFNQQQYISIKCVHDLMKVGCNISLEQFKERNKIDILKIIWQRNINGPYTVQIMANICLGFNIYIDKIWNGILKRMVAFNMHQDLNALIHIVSSKSQLKHIDGLILAWECVLMQPFQNAAPTRTLKDDNVLNKTLVRIQSCPVVRCLNLVKFAEHCLRLGRCHMAAIFLIFCKTTEQRQQIIELMKPSCNERMRQDILDLENVGISSVVINFSLNVLNL